MVQTNNPKFSIDRLQKHHFSQLMLRIFLITYVALVVVLAIIQSFLYVRTRSLLDSELGKNNIHQLTSIQETIDRIQQNCEDTLFRMMLDTDVRAFFSCSEESVNKYPDVKLKSDVYQKLITWASLPCCDSILIYDVGMQRIIASNSGSTSFIHYPYHDVLQSMLTCNSSPNNTYFFLSDWGNKQTLTFLLKVDISATRQGYIIINLGTESIISAIEEKNIDRMNTFFIVDSSERILIDTQNQYTGCRLQTLNIPEDTVMKILAGNTDSFTIMLQEHRMRFSYMPSVNSRLYYLQTVPYDHYATILHSLVNTTLWSLGIGVLIALGVSWSLARYAYRPIRIIASYINNPALVDENSSSDDEIRYILMKLLLANEKNAQLERQNLEQFNALRHAQANILQAQITPHFLYNTLQSIQMMVLMETCNTKSPAAEAIIVLSQIVRSGLQRGIDMVSLQDELEYLKKYIYLKQLSYPDTLHIQYSIPPEALCHTMPKLSLQPLVENVILHGMRENRVCEVRIIVHEKSDTFTIIVEDNGPGMSQSMIDAFNQLSEQDVIFRNQHVGIINLAQRLKLLYGDAAKLHLQRSALGGLRVEILLPKEYPANA